MNASPRRLRRVLAGFTLVELLAVIAIIGVLAAIVIPVVGHVRKGARTAQCSSNLRQIGQAMLLYAGDHAGRVPYQNPAEPSVPNALLSTNLTENWIRHIAPLLSINNRMQVDQVLNCPNSVPEAAPGAPYTYVMNRKAAGVPLNAFLKPAQFVLVRHTLRTNAANTVVEDIIEGPGGLSYSDKGGRFNYLFLDGHVSLHMPRLPWENWNNY